MTAQIYSLFEKQEQQVEEIVTIKSATSFGGGSSGGTMEPRIARLEADVAHIQKDIAEIKTDVREFRTGIAKVVTDLATLDANVKHLPTKTYINTSLLAMLAVIAALTVFQGSIQKLFNVAQSVTQKIP